MRRKFNPLIPEDCCFCLSEDVETVLDVHRAKWAVHCNGCEATGPLMDDELDAIVAWNIRAEADHDSSCTH